MVVEKEARTHVRGAEVSGTVVEPTTTTRRGARRLVDATRRSGEGVPSVTVHVAGMEDLELPPQFSEALLDMAGRVADGQAVVVTAVDEVLTTTRAAALLGVSRPTLGRLLDEGRIPYRQVGTHRRVTLSDLLSYQDRDIEARRASYERFVTAADGLRLDDGV